MAIDPNNNNRPQAAGIAAPFTEFISGAGYDVFPDIVESLDPASATALMQTDSVTRSIIQQQQLDTKVIHPKMLLKKLTRILSSPGPRGWADSDLVHNVEAVLAIFKKFSNNLSNKLVKELHPDIRPQFLEFLNSNSDAKKVPAGDPNRTNVENYIKMYPQHSPQTLFNSILKSDYLQKLGAHGSTFLTLFAEKLPLEYWKNPVEALKAVKHPNFPTVSKILFLLKALEATPHIHGEVKKAFETYAKNSRPSLLLFGQNGQVIQGTKVVSFGFDSDSE